MVCLTHIGDLSIMAGPDIRDRPAIVFAIPNFESMIGRRSDHSRSVEVVVYCEYKILVTMTETMKCSICCHVA